MILICSSNKIDGLEGRYAVAGLISEADLAQANTVYTDNARVIDLAKKLNVEVRDFPKHPPTGKKVDTPSPKPSQETKEQPEPLTDVLTPLVIEEPQTPTEGLTATSQPEAVKPEDMEIDDLVEYALANGVKRAKTMKRETILNKLAK